MLRETDATYPLQQPCEPLEPRLLFTAVPLINEFLASNDAVLADEDGDSSDWIELYNAGDSALSLDGWHLTDDAADLTQWTFPDVSLAPGEYLIVYASNKDRADADGTELHTNFAISAGGEYLALVEADGTTIAHEYAPQFPAQSSDVSYGLVVPGSQEVLIEEGADARYTVPGSTTPGWNATAFNDNGWSLGPTAIGYETSPADYNPLIESTVPNGTTSFYMRQQFSVTDLASVEGLELRLRYDDGFVAYLNGVLVESQNAPVSPSYNSSATGNHGDSLAVDFVGFDISDHLGALQAGNNVLAIQALNRPSNSDMLMEARLIATRDAGPATEGFMATPTPGSVNLASGPVIASVTQDPPQPTASQSLVIEAEVAENAGNGIGRVDLHYRIDFGSETALQMFDNGLGADASAGDGIYTATISSGFYSAGDMVRWYVTAEDSSGTVSRAPIFADRDGNNQSAEYFGTVVASSISTALPVFQWFTQNESASHTRSGTRASVFYNGRFYDNIFVRQRGGATNGAESQKFDFNKGEKLFINETLGSVGEINLNGNGGDSSYIRQPLAFETFAAAGHQSSASFLTYMSLNGSFDRVGVWVEQVDEDYLERHGLDPDGELFKMVQRPNLNPVFADLTGVERKTGDESDLSSMQALIDGLNLPTEAEQGVYIFDHLNLANIINYLAVRTIIQDTDDVRKNFYMYRDSNGSGEWYIFPWDKDWTFGVIGDGGTWHEHLFFGDEEHKKDNADQWNILYDVIFENPTTQEMYLRRLRTLMDQYLQPPGTSNGYFEQRVNALFNPADPHPGPSGSGRNSILSYLADRRGDLYIDFGPGSSPHVPGEQVPGAQPANPALTIGDLDFAPVSGENDEEYIQLINNNAFAIDISGWTVEGAITHTFRPGTVIAAGQSLYITAKSSAFRTRATGPSGGQGLFVQQWDSGQLSAFGETITIKRADGTTAAQLTYEGNNPGDITGDGFVGIEDLDQLLAYWGDSAVSSPLADAADLDNSGTAGASDLTIVFDNWGRGTPAAQPTSNGDVPDDPDPAPGSGGADAGGDDPAGDDGGDADADAGAASERAPGGDAGAGGADAGPDDAGEAGDHAAQPAGLEGTDTENDAGLGGDGAAPPTETPWYDDTGQPGKPAEKPSPGEKPTAPAGKSDKPNPALDEMRTKRTAPDALALTRPVVGKDNPTPKPGTEVRAPRRFDALAIRR